MVSVWDFKSGGGFPIGVQSLATAFKSKVRALNCGFKSGFAWQIECLHLASGLWLYLQFEDRVKVSKSDFKPGFRSSNEGLKLGFGLKLRWGVPNSGSKSTFNFCHLGLKASLSAFEARLAFPISL